MEYAFNKIRRAVLIEKTKITSLNQCRQILEQEFYGSNVYESRQFGLTYFYVKNNKVLLEAQIGQTNPTFHMLLDFDVSLLDKQSKSSLKEKSPLKEKCLSFFINFFNLNIEKMPNGLVSFLGGSDMEYVSTTKKIYTHDSVD